MFLYGLLRQNPSPTHSPFIHQKLLEAMGIEGQYATFAVKPEDIPQVVRSLKVLGYHGINVTMPYKEAVIPFLDEIAPEAAQIGAINTIHLKDGRSIGHNTDCHGFGMMLQEAGIESKGKSVVILGAGGAARAAVVHFANSGAGSVLVAARDKARLAELKGNYPFLQTALLQETDKLTGDIVVNVTPVGSHNHAAGSVVGEEILKRFGAAVDIVTTPPDTAFLAIAKRHGLRTASGVSMLVYQAVKAQEIFHSTTIDAEIALQIQQELRERLKG